MSAVGLAAGRERLLQELRELIVGRLAPGRAEVIARFADLYARRLPVEAAESLTAEELFGQVMGAFELAEGRGVEPIAVRVFNPTLGGDGYTTVGSVLETNTRDCPFLVDSISEELDSRGLGIRLLLHPVVGIERDGGGRITGVTGAAEAETLESVTHFEVDRHLPPAELDALRTEVHRILRDVQLAVGDFRPMYERVDSMIAAARAAGSRYEQEEVDETVAFLEWLREDNFVFLGYREYAIVGAGDDRAIAVTPGTGLGILRDEAVSSFADPVRLSTLDAGLRSRIEEGELLIVSKTNSSATVHRRARMDYIGVKTVGADGRVCGELRTIGLFTRKAYTEPAGRIPLLRRKLQQILAAEDFVPGSHDHKAAVELVENFPLDELLSVDQETLRATISELIGLQEQQKVRVFAHRDLFDRSVSVLVALPRDRFNAPLRKQLQELFTERFHGSGVDYHLSLGESDTALIHFRIHVGQGSIPDVDYPALEEEVIALTRTWDDKLLERLTALHGEERGGELAAKWSSRLPDYYKSATDVFRAVIDVEHLDVLDENRPFVVALRNERGQELETRIHLYKTGGRASLSELMPGLEALGLVVVEEVPVEVAGKGQIHIHDFGVVGPDGEPLDVSVLGELVADTLGAVWRGQTETDSLERLVILAGLTWRQVGVLRALRTYMGRISAGFTTDYQNAAFAANPGIAADLVRYFEQRLDPSRPRDERAEVGLREQILEKLDAVPSLDHDRILRSYLHLIEAIVRTNAFRPERDYLSFKIRSAGVPDMPRPYPLFEIFVHSIEMEGIHLRAGYVARGGIRWSDRREDYRTEVLGLMKTQTRKNVVIVPTGSKGGFVLKRNVPPEEVQEEVRRQYETLVRGLLDLTDTLADGLVVHPPDVRVLDEGDAYLVVAADRGTAAFSDVANAISQEYGFWLDDAFASGGSSGYDHKELAITSRGVWESVKRHFRELGRDVLHDPIRVAGIGDMSGDVFGNGMLYTDQIRLVAAFDHRHVFIDPDPDPATGLAERRRLSEQPGSSWEDYDPTLLSAGGGVWSRSAKSIPISEQAADALAIAPGKLTPNEVISAILRAPVDLLWNGGVGTFVRATDETDAEAGDRANDALRVTGRDVRALVVGEGGNLGFTQRGRIEYANAGGRINTDFIDNSAGVDLSDHEVNLKILLGLAEARGDLTRKQRDELLVECAEDVVRHVLYHNYLQAQILSQKVAISPRRIREFEDVMRALETEGLLDRTIECLPSSDQMAERERAGAGMARPELAVLLAYAKLSLKNAVLESTLPDDPYLERDLRAYFPERAIERFGHLLAEHPLRRELVATIVANDVVDSQGITFVWRFVAETGAEPADVVRAYRIAREVTNAERRWADIEALDGVIDPVVQNELMSGVDWLVELTARWFVMNAPGAEIKETVDANAEGFAELDFVLPELIPESSRITREQHAAELVARGAPELLARRNEYQPALTHAPDIVFVARMTGRSVTDVARAFFAAGQSLHLDWLESCVVSMPPSSRWERVALNAVVDDLLLVRREAVQKAVAECLDESVPAETALEQYLDSQPAAHARLDRLVEQLRDEGVDDLAVITVAVRQVRSLVS
jgi:glutamate dehydrogenase